MLCGCGTDAKRTTAGEPPLAVKVPIACERVLAPVPLPPAKESDDARAAFVKDEVALQRANGRLVRGRSCLADQRRLYAAPSK